MINLVQVPFYFTVLILFVICVLTANNMSENTCPCMRHCLKSIIIGLFLFSMAIFYKKSLDLIALSSLPILLGICGWLIFDKYRAHEEIDLLLSKIRNFWQKHRFTNE